MIKLLTATGKLNYMVKLLIATEGRVNLHTTVAELNNRVKLINLKRTSL